MKLLAFIALLILTSCGVRPSEAMESFAEFEENPVILPVIDDTASFSQITEIPFVIERAAIDTVPIFPNEVGEIMIIVYHGLHEYDPGPFDRLTSDFWNDLQTLYDQGYRLISLADLINNNITTPAGYTPVAITFDDGLPSAFSLMEMEDGTLAPVPGTAVYIMDAFYRKNPNFGRTAMFFINGFPEPFRGAGTLEERFRFLLDHGFEIGNHSYGHPNFAILNAVQLQREIGLIDQLMRRYGIEPLVLAYPFGIRPRLHLIHYAMAGEYNGIPYSYAWALRVGNTGVPAVSHHINFNPTNVSRVVASDESTPYHVVPDLGFLLRLFEQRPYLRFISDGDPNTITVPRNNVHLINMYSLGDKELVVYDIYEEYEEFEYEYYYVEHDEIQQAG